MATATRDAKKKDAPNRVQGIASDISELTLRSGKNLVVEIGAGVTPTPMLTRDMEASSAISVPVFDPTLNLLELSLLSEKFDAHVDGLAFRYLGASKVGKSMTLTFEDQVIARLRELTGPKKAFRAKMTRAEFIVGLVEELVPKVPVYCPQLTEKQPIEKKQEKLPKNERQSKKGAEEAKQNRGKGVGDTKGLKIKGQTPTPGQTELANTALEIASKGGAPFVCQVALIAALIDETDMGAVASNNVLEALGAGGAPIGNAEEEISGFLFGKPRWTGVTAVGFHNAHPTATFYEIAQEVQKSGAGNPAEGAPFLGSNYAAFGDESRQWVEAYGGATEGELTSGSEEVTEPYTFQVGKKENYWQAIQRLAKEVNWRAFVVAGRFFFISEPELSRGQVRLAIEREPGQATPSTSGIIDVDFDFNANKRVTEATVTAMAKHWTPPPGAVVTLKGYGPASIGPGDAPPKKGAKIGLSSNIKASTHEGKGRYLVSKIEAPLSGDPETRRVTITLIKPTQPLPEKTATTKTLTKAGAGAAGSGEGNATTERMVAELERVSAMEKAYLWGGFDPGLGFDCSGLVSYALKIGGFLTERLTTSTLAGFGEAGAGELITVYDHANTGDPHTEHTAIEVEGRVFESGGGSENSNPNGGAGEVKSGIPAFLAQFEIKRHPKGF